MTVANMANIYKLKAFIFSRGTLLYVISLFVRSSTVVHM
jgi:hypothetical protein